MRVLRLHLPSDLAVPLSLLTINIWNNDGPWAERLPLLRDWIALLRPDVLVAQEVLHGAGVDQLAAIAPGLGNRAFAAMGPFWGDPALTIGVGIATHFNVLAKVEQPLPSAHSADESRCALGAAVATPFGLWPVFTTHFSWWPSATAERLAQAVTLAGFMSTIGKQWYADFAADPALRLPITVGGDFNETPEGDAMRFLTGRLAQDNARAAYLDAWAMVGTGAGETMVSANPFVPAGVLPDSRIDHVLVARVTPGSRGRLRVARRVLDVPHKGIYPSDHFGVYVEIETELG